MNAAAFGRLLYVFKTERRIRRMAPGAKRNSTHLPGQIDRARLQIGRVSLIYVFVIRNGLFGRNERKLARMFRKSAKNAEFWTFCDSSLGRFLWYDCNLCRVLEQESASIAGIQSPLHAVPYHFLCKNVNLGKFCFKSQTLIRRGTKSHLDFFRKFLTIPEMMQIATVPLWNTYGVLPPIAMGEAGNSLNRSPYRIGLSEFVDYFSYSKQRIEILRVVTYLSFLSFSELYSRYKIAYFSKKSHFWQSRETWTGLLWCIVGKTINRSPLSKFWMDSFAFAKDCTNQGCLPAFNG